MSDIWELGRYVEDHPDEHEQRWRLAKKLYLACEYRLALEHLQVLQNEWVRKLNVVRYLAATYYRLGRYDEAVTELLSAIEEWPDETGLREQLARVLETAGRPEEAARVWDEVAWRYPDHPIAQQAAERLRRRPGEAAPEEDLHLHESDSGIDLAPKRLCPVCGAQNGAEFDRCWRCHADLAGGVDSPRSFTPADTDTLRRSLAVVASVVAVLLVGVGAYAAFSALPPGLGETDGPGTVYEALLHRLLVLRLVVGGVLLLTWPLVLLAALAMGSSDSPGRGVVALTGAVLAVLTFGATWAPFHVATELALLLFLVSLCLIGALFGLGLRDTVTVWLFQAVAVASLIAVTVAAVEGFTALVQFPAVARYARTHDAGPPSPRERASPPASVPAEIDIEWESTGSSWLDAQLARTEFIIETERTTPPLWFSIEEANRARRFGDLITLPHREVYDVLPRTPYTLNVSGQPEQHGIPVRLVVRGLLKPHFNPTPGKAGAERPVPSED